MRRSELKRSYKEARPRMGVFVIRNRLTHRFKLQATRNLRGSMNRVRFEITPSTRPNQALLDDWKAFGPEAFEVRILDELEPPKDELGWDPTSDLEELEAMWRARLLEQGATPY